MSIVPYGLNRISSPLQMHRSLSTLQHQQAAMAKLEQQLSTETRYQYGSEDPFAAATTLAVQMTMERKTQNKTNLQSAQSYLTATDSTLAQIGTLTNEARSMALDAINTITGATQRSALADTVKQTIQQIYNFGNNKYLDRHLFAGATTDQKPFAWGNDAYGVSYLGSEQNVYTWTNTDLLTATNMNGVEVFGAVSEPIRGTSDLGPSLGSTTLLSTLHGGQGIEKGVIRLTYTGANGTETTSVEIDLSQCYDIDDVRMTIAKNVPVPAKVQIDITDRGLSVTLSETTPGSLTITEVGKGRSAHQLGIFTTAPILSGETFVGADLDPALTELTSLDALLGSRATATLAFEGLNNNIILRARQNGSEVVDPATGETLWPLNGIEVSFLADSTIEPGAEQVVFDAENNRLTVLIHPDNTNANNIVAAINTASESGMIPPFEASLDPMNNSGSGAGTGIIALLPGIPYSFGTTAYGSGEPFDKSSGLQIVNGGKTQTVDFSDCKTVGEMLARLNDPLYGLTASINAAKTGIDIRTRISGTDFMVGENGGSTATQLGVRSLTAETKLDELDYGRGVSDYEGPGTNASALYESKSANSALRLTAKAEGVQWNDFTVNYVTLQNLDDGVSVSWDEEARTITIGINPGVTTACEIVAAFEAQPGPRQYFDLTLDQTNGSNSGLGVVYDGTVATSGGSDGGVDFTITRNDGMVFDIDIHGATTLGDVLRIINTHPDNTGGLLEARLNAFGNGIELVDHSVGRTATRVDRTLLSTAAIELGLVPRGEEYRTQTFDGSHASTTVGTVENGSLLFLAQSAGVYANDVRVEILDMNAPGGAGTPTFQWDAASQTLRFQIDPAATTANDLIALFQAQAGPQVRGLFDVQNAPNEDGSPSSGAGLVQLTGTELPRMAGGEDTVLTGDDPNPLEADSLFNALIRLQQAMEKNDTREIERSVQLLDNAVDRLDGARAEIGVRQKGLDTVETTLADEYVQHRQTLLESFEIDITTVTLEYMAQQLSYEASLSVTGRMYQYSLMNYI